MILSSLDRRNGKFRVKRAAQLDAFIEKGLATRLRFGPKDEALFYGVLTAEGWKFVDLKPQALAQATGERKRLFHVVADGVRITHLGRKSFTEKEARELAADLAKRMAQTARQSLALIRGGDGQPPEEEKLPVIRLADLILYKTGLSRSMWQTAFAQELSKFICAELEKVREANPSTDYGNDREVANHGAGWNDAVENALNLFRAP
jgi:hypothetical protein